MGLFESKQGIAEQLLQALLFGQQNPQLDGNLAIREQGAMNDLQTQRIMNAFGSQGKPIRNKNSAGNVIDPITGQSAPAQGPNLLDVWYQNNPNSRSGEFDPTGSKALARGQQTRDTEQLQADAAQVLAQAELNTALGLENSTTVTAPGGQPTGGQPAAGAPTAAPAGGGNAEIAALRDQLSKMGGIMEAFVSEGTAPAPAPVAPPAASFPPAAPADPFSQGAIDNGSLAGAQVAPTLPTPFGGQALPVPARANPNLGSLQAAQPGSAMSVFGAPGPNNLEARMASEQFSGLSDLRISPHSLDLVKGNWHCLVSLETVEGLTHVGVHWSEHVRLPECLIAHKETTEDLLLWCSLSPVS